MQVTSRMSCFVILTQWFRLGGAYVLLVLWLEYALWIAVEIIRRKISMWSVGGFDLGCDS